MSKKYIAILLINLMLFMSFGILSAGAAEVGAEVLSNGGFETVNTDESSTNFGRPSPWSSSHGWTGNIKVESGTDGNYVKMTRPANDTSNMHIVQSYRPVEPGASYRFQVAFCADSGTNPTVQVMYREVSSGSSFDYISVSLSPADGEWHTQTIDFTAPASEEGMARNITVNLRFLGKVEGEICWDGVSCIKTAEAPAVTFETDAKFYYTGTETGTATIRKTGLRTLDANTVVDFSLQNAAGTVIESDTDVSFAGETAQFSLPVASFTEKETYTVSYTIRNGETVIETGQETVYRYDRPSMITEDGEIMKDGERFFPVMGYHVQANNETEYAYCRDAGINVIQFFPPNTNPATLTARLNTLQSYGLSAFVALYSSSEEDALAVVQAVKNHSAVFGYMLMDEPLHNGTPLETLERLYKIVRDNDDVHPTYLVESMGKLEHYPTVAKYTDIFATDPYPSGTSATETYAAMGVAAAIEAVNGEKPVMCIVQTFPRGITPTGEEVRNMVYQALLEGADGIGYYDIHDYVGYNDGEALHIWQRECWDSIVSFADYELDFVKKAFITGEYPSVTKSCNAGANVWYQTFRDGENIWCVLQNRTTAAQTAAVPADMPDTAGIYVVSGQTPATLSISGGTLSISLAGSQAILCKLTPSQAVEEESNLLFLTDGQEIDSLSEGTITARYRFFAEGKSTSFSLLMALFEEGKVALAENIEISELYHADEGKIKVAEVKMNIEETQNRYVKVFVWEQAMKPMENPYILKSV